MKTKLLIASVFSFIFTAPSFAQWVQQSSGTAANFSGITCANMNVCYVAGANGVIRKTVNGGTNWTISASGSTSNFASIRARDSANVWIGLAQQFRYTANAGALWTAMAPATSISTHVIYDIAYLSPTFYIAVGGSPSNTATGGYVSLKTIAGGAAGTWIPINVSGQGTMFGVSALNDSTYVAVGGSLNIYKTTDSAATWVKKDSGSATSVFYDVHFPTATVGYAVGGTPSAPTTGGIAKKSIDGGSTWIPLVLPITNTLYGVHFTDASTGYVVGNSGVVYKTTDGGLSWNQQFSTVGTDLMKVVFMNDTVGYATGSGGVIIKTINGGFPTGITETHTANGCTVFGNPSHTQMKIETDFDMMNGELTIVNELGQVTEVKKNIAGNTIDVNTSSFPSGLYFFRLNDGEISASGKFIVE